jgi:type II secretory pathway pseudopilin PulG
MKRKGIAWVELLVVVFCVVLLILVLVPGLRRSRQTLLRLMCRTNLEGLGQAMEVFADDNEGRYPRAGGAGATWTPDGALLSWYGGIDFEEPSAFGYVLNEYGFFKTPGKATITSSWYLLIKYYNLSPKHFVCKSDVGASEFKMHNYYPPPYVPPDGHPVTLQDVFDFGLGGRSRSRRTGEPLPWPGQVVSYAYHMPYSSDGGPSFKLTAGSNPATPVAADRNPYLDKNATDVDPNSNSAAHQGLGQNVLYMDGSVRFERSPKVGIGGDNIYTYGGGPEGTGPAANGEGFPADRDDAYLVSEQNYR